ncbi:hypothetical protein KR222_006811, partial [Zaprionus bogoriensis]
FTNLTLAALFCALALSFALSADCCSSRILLLREHTLQIEEHVVQMVNQLELQRQLDASVDDAAQPGAIAIDTGQMLRVLPAELGLGLGLGLGLEGELAAMATTERDSNTNKETPGTTTTTTRTTSASTATTTTATGEPPPDDSTERMTTEVAASTTTTATTTTTTAATTTSTTTTSTPTPTGSRTSAKPNASDELSFKLPCDDMYTLNFCLNGGNCYRWAMSNSFSYCVCPDGYVGERCDSKTEDGVYVPIRPTALEPQLKTAHVVFSFPMLVLLSSIYVLFGAVFMFRNVLAQRRKQQQQQQQLLHLNNQRFFVSC